MSVLPDTAVVEAGRLAVGGVALADLAPAHGTPLYVYDEATLRARARAYRDGLRATPAARGRRSRARRTRPWPCCGCCSRRGWGWTSPRRASWPSRSRQARPASGSSCTATTSPTPMSGAAVAAGAGLLVVDHLAELDQVERIAAAAGRIQPCWCASRRASRPRRTRRSERPRGVEVRHGPRARSSRAIERAAACPHVRPAGLHVHLGSQIRDVGTYLEAVDWLAGFPGDRPSCRCSTSAAGSPSPTPTTTGPRTSAPRSRRRAAVAERFDPLPELMLEPGRSIVGPAA